VATTFLIRNQHGQYLTKKREWASGKDVAVLFQQIHFDQALNQLVEVNSKDIALRLAVVELKLSASNKPIVTEFGPEPELSDLPKDEGGGQPAPVAAEDV